MAEIPGDLQYTKEHEWVRFEGNVAVVGITDHAQGLLGDIVFVDLPPEGSEVEEMKPFGSVESVKAASDLYSPLTGKVVEVNGELDGAPETVNSEPYGNGWMIKIDCTKLDEEKANLLDAAAYGEVCAE